LDAGSRRPSRCRTHLKRMKPGLRVFGFICGLLAAGACVAVLKPGLIRDTASAVALRPYALVLAAILCVGGMRALVPRGGPGRRAAP